MQVFIRTLILGIVSGSVYALASVGLVLTYKTSGVLNFGYGAIALFTSYIYWTFTAQWHFPVLLAAIIVVCVIAPIIGAALDASVFRRIEGQPQIISVIATVGLFVLFEGLIFIPPWRGASHSVPSLFPAGTIRLPGGTIIGKDQFGILTVAVVGALGLGAMLRYTRIGVAFRAVVSNRSVAGLMSINTGYISGLSWALGIGFAALMGVLLTPQTLLDPLYLPPFIIAFVLGAAVVGYMRSLPLAWLGGVFIGIVQSFFIQYVRSQGLLSQVSNSVPFIMITLAVLLAPRAIRQAGAGASFIVRVNETVRSASRNTRFFVAAALFGFLALLPLWTSISWRASITQGMIFAIVFLSFVVLTGFSGQISLGHTAFMGIAAFGAAHAVRDAHLPVWLAIFVGALAAVPAGNLIGFIAVRVHGLYLALMTLAFAFLADQLFFQSSRVSGGEGGIPVPRPAGFQSEKGLFYLALGFLILFSIIALNLRTGRTGRVLAAMRDSETASRALGIPVTRYKVLIFGLSAFIAGFGGVLFAMILETATSRTFIPFYSLFYLAIAVLGGIFDVGGAIAGGLLFGLYTKLSTYQALSFLNQIQFIVFGLGATVVLAGNPEGLIWELRRAGAKIRDLFGQERHPARPSPVPVAGGQE